MAMQGRALRTSGSLRSFRDSQLLIIIEVPLVAGLPWFPGTPWGRPAS